MRCLFRDDIPLAQLVLLIITGKPDLIIAECQAQKDMKRLAGARSICLNAYGIVNISGLPFEEIKKLQTGQ